MTEAREEVVTVRVTKKQKRRIQKLAKKKGETVSTLLLRAAETAGALLPREAKEMGKEIIISIGGDGAESERPEVHATEGVTIRLSPEAEKLAQ